jgi:ketosteroid isomerase-like protein
VGLPVSLTLAAVLSFSAFAVEPANKEGEAMKAKDNARIKQVVDDWIPALQSGSVDRNAAFYANDVVIAGEGSWGVYVGLAQVRGMLEKLLGDTSPTECSIEVLGVEITGDWAELRARFKAVWQPKREGIEVERESSNYIWLLKRQPDDSWKIVRFLFYSS